LEDQATLLSPTPVYTNVLLNASDKLPTLEITELWVTISFGIFIYFYNIKYNITLEYYINMIQYSNLVLSLTNNHGDLQVYQWAVIFHHCVINCYIKSNRKNNDYQ